MRVFFSEPYMRRSYWHIQAGTANSIIWAPTYPPPSTSLSLGCHGQPEAVSQSLKTLLRYPVPQMAAEKWGPSKMQMNLWRCTEPGTFRCHFSSSDISIQLFKNDTEKPFGPEVGSFLLSWAVLLSINGIGNKATSSVGRMTSQLGQAPRWGLFHRDPSDGPRPHLENTLESPSSPWN